jgi:hypothetical protein
MSRIIVTLTALVVASTSFASDPGRAHAATKPPATKSVMSNPYLRMAAELDRRDRETANATVRSFAMIACPQPRMVEFMQTVRYDSDPDDRRRNCFMRPKIVATAP